MERSSARLKVFAILVAIMFAALSTRLWFLQVLATEVYAQEAQNNSVRTAKTDALRGEIWSSDQFAKEQAATDEGTTLIERRVLEPVEQNQRRSQAVQGIGNRRIAAVEALSPNRQRFLFSRHCRTVLATVGAKRAKVAERNGQLNPGGTELLSSERDKALGSRNGIICGGFPVLPEGFDEEICCGERLR